MLSYDLVLTYGIIYSSDMTVHILLRHKRHNCISSAQFVMVAVILYFWLFHFKLGEKKYNCSCINKNTWKGDAALVGRK